MESIRDFLTANLDDKGGCTRGSLQLYTKMTNYEWRFWQLQWFSIATHRFVVLATAYWSRNSHNCFCCLNCESVVQLWLANKLNLRRLKYTTFKNYRLLSVYWSLILTVVILWCVLTILTVFIKTLRVRIIIIGLPVIQTIKLSIKVAPTNLATVSSNNCQLLTNDFDLWTRPYQGQPAWQISSSKARRSFPVKHRQNICRILSRTFPCLSPNIGLQYSMLLPFAKTVCVCLSVRIRSTESKDKKWPLPR